MLLSQFVRNCRAGATARGQGEPPAPASTVGPLMLVVIWSVAAFLTWACAPRCEGTPYLLYQANASAPRLYLTHEGRALFFAATAAAPHVLFEYDGTRLNALDDTLERTPLTWGIYEGSAVVLTETALFRLNASSRLERIGTLPVVLSNSPPRMFPVGFLVEFQRRLFFPGTGDARGACLWAYDPQTGEAERLQPPGVEHGGLGLAEAQVVGDTLIFNLGTPGDWWAYDGSAFHNVSHTGHDVWPSRTSVLYQGALWFNADGGVRVYDGVSSVIEAYAGDLVPVGVVGASLFLWHRTPDWNTSAAAQLWVRDSGGFARVPIDVSWCKQAGNFVADQSRLYFACDVPYPAEDSRALMSYDVTTSQGRVLVAHGGHTLDGFTSFWLGILPWRGDLLFTSAVRRSLQTTEEQDFEGDGLEPWIYRADGGEASMLEDLYPGVTLTHACRDP